MLSVCAVQDLFCPRGTGCDSCHSCQSVSLHANSLLFVNMEKARELLFIWLFNVLSSYYLSSLLKDNAPVRPHIMSTDRGRGKTPKNTSSRHLLVAKVRGVRSGRKWKSGRIRSGLTIREAGLFPVCSDQG